MSHSAAVVDTRANVLAEILPASCTYAYSDNAVLAVANEGATFAYWTGSVAGAVAVTGVANDAAACGTAHYRTAAGGRGILVVDNAAGSANAVATEFDPTQKGELSGVVLTLGANAQVKLGGDLSVGDLAFGSDTAKLDLDGHVLKVNSPWHAYSEDRAENAGDWIDDPKKPGYANIKWSIPGIVIFFQ